MLSLSLCSSKRGKKGEERRIFPISSRTNSIPLISRLSLSSDNLFGEMNYRRMNYRFSPFFFFFLFLLIKAPSIFLECKINITETRTFPVQVIVNCISDILIKVPIVFDDFFASGDKSIKPSLVNF